MARPLAAPVLLLLLLSPGAAGCGGGEPETAWPEGSVVVGDTGALRRVLEGLAGWRGTPLGRRAGELAARLEGCETFAAEAPAAAPAELLPGARCGEPTAWTEGLRALRRDGDLAFFLRLPGEARLAGTARVAADGSVTADARLHVEGDAGSGATALAWPAETPPGPPRLASGDALAQARLRPAGGLDLASLVPEGGQGDRLFRLKSELFAGAVLDGAWEMAVYLPPEGRRMPLAALGLDVGRPGLAVAAMERFVADLEATWSVQATPFAVGARRGACMLRLNLMPELAPCYVATGDQLVVGWNPASLRQALAPGTAPGDAGLGKEGGIVLQMERFAEADRRLRHAHAPETPPARIDYAWRRALARIEPAADALRIRLELPARAPVRVSASER